MKTERKHIAIAAGGTGGHVMPALAVARELLARGHDVIWFGTQNSFESRLLANEPDISFVAIPARRLRGKSWLTWISAPWMLLRSTFAAWRALRCRRVNALIGFGGFVSGPALLAAKCLRIPLLIHEQNAIAGTTNRLLAYFANRICTAYPNAFHPKHRVILTGNPVRSDCLVFEPPRLRTESAEPLQILILGGSQGARFLNTTLPPVFKELSKNLALTIHHQTGVADLEQVRKLYGDMPNVYVTPFISEMAQAYAEADLILARAGAITIAEICAVGRAAILIPLPWAIDDHQLLNAQFMTAHQAALLLKQIDASEIALRSVLESLLRDHRHRHALAQAAYTLRKPDATVDIVQALLEIIRRY